MNRQDARTLLENVKSGSLSVEEALTELRKAPYKDLGFAKLDSHRGIRTGVAEVIYGAGKTADQILKIVRAMEEKTILITRLDEDKAEYLRQNGLEFFYEENAHIARIGEPAENTGVGKIVIITGGTSDMYVAEEAAVVAETLGNEVVRIYDAGVAGIHRLMDHIDEIMDATVIIAIAGMEGALASVVGGLADCPVIAVPTSVGYGANFEGLSALLSMINSCANGISVVNIDNGFGAGYQASLINHTGVKS